GWKTDLILETHDAFCDTRTVLELFDAAGAPMPLIWDSHHTWKLGKEPLMATWSALRDSVKHVHYKDSISQPSARHPYTYVLPGDGEFPSQELFSLLSREGFAGPISLEWEKQWHPELPDLSLALEKARQIAGW
ncbi:MAG TPA: TIM barrel protein, partial [Opitutaceae bacterium]|nr:TIM barrel protein [Opitutaceae bacterium]